MLRILPVARSLAQYLFIALPLSMSCCLVLSILVCPCDRLSSAMRACVGVAGVVFGTRGFVFVLTCEKKQQVWLIYIDLFIRVLFLSRWLAVKCKHSDLTHTIMNFCSLEDSWTKTNLINSMSYRVCFSADDSEIELKHCKSSRIPWRRREHISCT